MRRGVIMVLALCVLAVARSVSAQADGTMPPADPSAPATQQSSTPSPAPAAADPVPASTGLSQPAATPVAVPAAATTSPAPSNASPTTVIPPKPAPATTDPQSVPALAPVPEVATTTPTTSAAYVDADSSMTWVLWWVVGFLALLPFGYVISGWFQKKPSNTQPDQKGGQCFDLKQMMDDKLQELTYVRGQIEAKVKDAAKAELRDAVTGTVAGDLLTHADALEADYNRIKKLFEKCMWDCGGTRLHGSIVESSLVDTAILKDVKIIETKLAGDWTVHAVEVASKQLPELAKRIADGPWYMHFWESGKDDVRVVFREKTFDIKYSDKSTWADAIAYGTQIGIPPEQLDFAIHE